jgi:aromatic amino acid transport protein AroP
VAVNYLLPQSALELLMSLVVAALVINWTMISLTHLKFRRVLRQRHVTPAFKAFWSPLANYLCLAFVAFLLLLMLDNPGTRASVIALPIWVALMGLCYRLQIRLQGRAVPA